MTRALLALAALAAVGCGACGSPPTATTPAWVATHSSTPVLAFDTSAPGICQLTVRYPDEAPAAIEYGGTVFVQVGKEASASPPPGASTLGTSGDWTVVRATAATLVLYARNARYDYRAEATC